MNKLQKMTAAVDRFILKASKKNEPLEAFRGTDDFKQFESDLSGGISSQVKDLMNKLPGWVLTQQTLDEDKLAGWLEDNQTPIFNYVTERSVVDVLVAAFIYSVQSCYARHGASVKKAAGPSVAFDLTNSYYLDALADQANYLLHKSSMDETTRSRLITLIRDTRSNQMTLDELTNLIVTEFDGISDTRAFLIANTEANQAMSTAQHAFLKENGFKTKEWIPAGPSTCSICQGNADQGPIPLNQNFESGDETPPGHPGCECYEDAGDEIDLDEVEILWDGS